MFIFTSIGFEEKSRLTFSFDIRKFIEYEILKREINRLKIETEEMVNKKL